MKWKYGLFCLFVKYVILKTLSSSNLLDLHFHRIFFAKNLRVKDVMQVGKLEKSQSFMSLWISW